MVAAIVDTGSDTGLQSPFLFSRQLKTEREAGSLVFRFGNSFSIPSQNFTHPLNVLNLTSFRVHDKLKVISENR